MYAELGACEIARLIRAGKASPVEVVTEFLARIASHNERLRALSSVNTALPDEAAKLAKVSAAQRKKAQLLGVPYSAKENIDVVGLPVGRASKQYPSRIAPHNAAIVEKLCYEKALCVGKGNMPERGRAFVTDNPTFGRTLNPFHPEVTAGGSSGGDAAAVAAGFAAFGLANDAGGSIRVPAAFCGLFGLFPTGGTMSDAGLSLPPTSLMSLFRRSGVITRSLEDLGLLHSLLSGFDPLDAGSIPTPDGGVDGVGTYAVIHELNGIPCHDSVTDALLRAEDSLKSIGMRAVPAPAQLFEQTAEPFILLMAQAGLLLEDEILARTPAVPETGEGPILQHLRSRIASELPPLTPERLLLAWNKLHLLRHASAKALQDIDCVLMPVCAVPPPRHEATAFRIGQRAHSTEEVYQFSFVVNALGLPAVAFPMGLDADGLPIGLQLVGKRFSEPLLIRLLREAGHTSSTPAPLLSNIPQ